MQEGQVLTQSSCLVFPSISLLEPTRRERPPWDESQVRRTFLRPKIRVCTLANSAYPLGVYGGIHEGLQGTLTGGNFNPINAFLFCGGNGLTFGTFPGNPSEYRRTISSTVIGLKCGPNCT